MKPILVALLCVPVAAQDPSGAGKSKAGPVLPPIGKLAAPAPEDDPHEEMKRLFAKVERRLREIDRLLADAGAGDAASAARARAAGERASAGISALIRSSREGGNEVVRDIDRILEIAEHPHEPGGT